MKFKKYCVMRVREGEPQFWSKKGFGPLDDATLFASKEAADPTASMVKKNIEERVEVVVLDCELIIMDTSTDNGG